MSEFNVIDLFAGCGGLSLGLAGAGGKTLFAVELSPMAAETYWWNFIRPKSKIDFEGHLKLSLSSQAKAGLAVGDIVEINAKISDLIDEDGVDVVAGGPPCQGFSLAGRRKKGGCAKSLALGIS